MAEAEAQRVFFVRHAESVWNAAKASRNLLAMASDRDHPLTSRGLQQARLLRQALSDASTPPSPASPPPSPPLASMAAAREVWCSPFTRALQTSLLALQPVLEAGAFIRLKPCVREKKNLGGLDSIGKARGAACIARAVERLEASGGATAEEVARAREAHVQSGEAEARWWWRGRSPREGKAQVQRRVRAMFSELEATPAAAVIVVGHSHFFRQMFRTALHPDVRRRLPASAERLCHAKMPHCGVVCCTMDYADGTPRIVDVQIWEPPTVPRSGRRWRQRRVAPE